jgi:lipopolysaccharide export system permease protein
LLEQVVNKNAPIALILSFISYVIPFSLTFTLPWGFLTSVLLVFGRLSADNELTAMRTSGLSIPRISLPVGFLAMMFTAVCLWINLDIAPAAQASMKSAIVDIATSNPLALFGSDRIISELPDNKIYVELVEPNPTGRGNKLHNLHIYHTDDRGALDFVMFAREGTLELKQLGNSEKSPTATALGFLDSALATCRHWAKSASVASRREFGIVLTFTDGRYEGRSNDHPDDISRWQPAATIQSGSMSISLQKLYEQKKKFAGISTLDLQQLLRSDRAEKVGELNKRISNGLATLVFTLLAIPLGITAQRKETSVGFAISLAICLSYYALSFGMSSLSRAHPNITPELFIWAPNVLFLIVGCIGFFKLSRR